MPDNLQLIKDFLGQLMDELSDARRFYAEMLGIQKNSKTPGSYEELLETAELWGEKIKTEIREVTNGSYTF